MTDILNEGPIDPNDERYRALLRNLQGNILKGHGRDHATLVFFRFNRPAEDLRDQLRQLLQWVRSAEDQLREASEFKTFQVPGALFANFFLSATGYKHLGFDLEAMVQAFGWQNMSSLGLGMKQPDSIQRLKDPPIDQWEEPYRGRVDALLLLADDDPAFLLRRTREAVDAIDDFAEILVVEHGEALRDENGVGVEHLGFADGRSQPLFFKSQLPDGDEPTVGWKQGAPLRLVLIKDPTVPDEAAYGSFLVFRKLEQNIRGFVSREQELATELGLQGEDRKRVGAMVIGRFRDGTPLVRHGTAGQPNEPNDFTYAEDPNGARCPFHAHIRKTNPRGEAPGFTGVEDVRIVRRAMPYGVREHRPAASLPPGDQPSTGAGLLFMCFQQNIEKQFNFIQVNWANADSAAGLDPLVGHGAANSQKWPDTYGAEGSSRSGSFAGFVKMKGGEYFFAPSIPFLRKLTP